MGKVYRDGKWIVSDVDVITSSRAANKFGEYAILPTEARCSSFLPFWENTTAYVMTSPERGSNFVQMDLKLAPGGGNSQPVNDGLEQFLFVTEGQVELTLDNSGEHHIFGPRDFAWLPPEDLYFLKNHSDAECSVVWLRKPYEPVAGWKIPDRVIGNEIEICFEERDTHIERHLIPFATDRAFDLCLKTLYFEPGVYFSLVESHVQEHGLVMLQGQGVYYLNGNYHEVRAGDFIYMAPWCLQMMYASGWSTAGYLLYKEYNRDYISRFAVPRIEKV